MPEIKTIAQYCATGLEALGIMIIVLASLVSVGAAVVEGWKGKPGEEIFRNARHRFARGILLGLEPLVAGDIVHTVAIDLTFQSVGVLAIIVAIRTFLSFTLEVELTGRWPWQKPD